MKKIFLLAVVILFSFSSSFSQSSTVKYQQIDGNTYKFTYYKNQILQSKEHVKLIEGSNEYQSLDYYEMYDEKGNMIFKGNKIKGRQLTYFTTGEKKTQSMVVHSKIEGRQVSFNKKGKVMKVEMYKAGELVDTVK